MPTKRKRNCSKQINSKHIKENFDTIQNKCTIISAHIIPL